jgi:hypothetical protein
VRHDLPLYPLRCFATSRLNFRSTTTYRLCCKYQAQYEVECATASSLSYLKGRQVLRLYNRIAEIGGQLSKSCVPSYTAPLSLRYYEFLQAASGAFSLCGCCSCLDRLPRDPATTPDLDFPQQRAAVSKSSPCLAMQLMPKLCTWRPLLCNSST